MNDEFAQVLTSKFNKNDIIIVTGGSGFIGSHIVDVLADHVNVIVVDNFSYGQYKRNDVKYLNLDITNSDSLKELYSLTNIKAIFHFAALASVKESNEQPERYVSTNVLGTLNMLNVAKYFNADFVFASSSTVYGNAHIIPTPEVAPLLPVSVYGATKVSAESLINAYSNMNDIRSTIVRFANIFGERSIRGVIYDFFIKLMKNPNKLRILGNGNQMKSYLYISDAINAIFTAYLKQSILFDVFNVGSKEQHSVNEIAKLISKELNLNPSFEYTGGNIGWSGDVPKMFLDTSKLELLGWKQRVPFEEGIHRYISYLKDNLHEIN